MPESLLHKLEFILIDDKTGAYIQLKIRRVPNIDETKLPAIKLTNQAILR